MRGIILCCLTALLVGSVGWAQPNPKKRVTHTFENADLVRVLHILAQDSGRKIYVGPTVQGSVTIELVYVPLEEALSQVLAQQENEYGFKIFDGPTTHTIVVAPPDKLAAIGEHPGRPPQRAGSVRMEYLLERAPAAKVIDFLKSQYPEVEFTPHPTMNGFYARGTREELLQIKRELANLDRTPSPPPPPLREFLPVRHSDIHKLLRLADSLKTVAEVTD